jgi:hypothetical protein
MPPKKAKKVPSETEPVERRTTWLRASSLPDPIMCKHENNTSTDMLQPGSSPGIISLSNSDSDISDFEEGVNRFSTKTQLTPARLPASTCGAKLQLKLPLRRSNE